MKLVTRRHRVLAVLFGIALLVILVTQMWRDGRRLIIEKAKINFQSRTK
jgi:hypothetical protein